MKLVKLCTHITDKCNERTQEDIEAKSMGGLMNNLIISVTILVWFGLVGIMHFDPLQPSWSPEI